MVRIKTAYTLHHSLSRKHSRNIHTPALACGHEARVWKAGTVWQTDSSQSALQLNYNCFTKNAERIRERNAHLPTFATARFESSSATEVVKSAGFMLCVPVRDWNVNRSKSCTCAKREIHTENIRTHEREREQQWERWKWLNHPLWHPFHALIMLPALTVFIAGVASSCMYWHGLCCKHCDFEGTAVESVVRLYCGCHCQPRSPRWLWLGMNRTTLYPRMQCNFELCNMLCTMLC